MNNTQNNTSINKGTTNSRGILTKAKEIIRKFASIFYQFEKKPDGPRLNQEPQKS